MRINYIYTMAAAFLLMASCSKEIGIKPLEFDASVEKEEVESTEAAIFNFKGSPDMISFYSGEPGGRYEFKDRTVADGTPVLNFTTVRTGVQANSLSLMVSSDFLGMVTDKDQTLDHINKANWTNLTSLANLATTSATASGNIDLSAYASENKNVYIAFKYIGLKGTVQNKWTITALSLVNKLADGTSYTIANLNANTGEISNYGAISYSPGWISATVANKYNWVITAGTSLVITGATSVATSTEDSEAWVIMGPINLKKVTPDFGTSIKKQQDNMAAFPYIHLYSAAGSYQPTFVAINASRHEQSQKVVTLKVNVK